MSIRTRKNLHHLVEAYSKIDTADCKLVLAGDTDFEDSYSLSLKKQAKENGVILTGFIKGENSIHSLLTAAAIACLLHTKVFLLLYSKL